LWPASPWFTEPQATSAQRRRASDQ
jgi:hypothetical protein